MEINFEDPTPLYKQVADAIKRRIMKGELKVGDKLDSQQKLAQKYQVSMITIKKALGELTSQGILYGRVGMGTFVAKSIVSMVSMKRPTIGMVLRDLNNPFFSLIAQSFENKAYDEGYNLILSHSSNRMDKEEEQIQRFLELGVDGLIIASMSHEYRANKTILQLHESRFPYVMVSYMRDKHIYFVGTDHVQGGYIAAKHLIQLGYKKIGYINAEKGNPIGALRKKGFLKALQENDIRFPKKYEFFLKFRGDWDDYYSGYEIGEEFIKQSDKPEAMFVYKDLAALGFQRALLNSGLKLPEDVALVGYDDIKRGVVAPVPLTTIHQPTDQIGVLAFEFIKKQMNKEKIENPHMILEPSLVVRDSCGARELSVQSMRNHQQPGQK